MGTAGRQTDSSANSTGQGGTGGVMQCSELQWNVPMCAPLPIEILNLDEAFPFLDTTLQDLGIAPSAVQERVVWVDSRCMKVRKSGKLKEKQVLVVEVRVTAQQPGDGMTREVVCGSETHSDRSYCRSFVDILPWKQSKQETDLKPVEVTLAFDTKAQSK